MANLKWFDSPPILLGNGDREGCGGIFAHARDKRWRFALFGFGTKVVAIIAVPTTLPGASFGK
jgi:hypothetical protein